MALSPTILIADRDTNALSDIHSNLQLQFPVELKYAGSKQKVQAFLKDNHVDILLLDLDFCDDEDISTYINTILTHHPKLQCIPTIPAGREDLVKKILELDLIYFVQKPLDPIETTLAVKRVCDKLLSQTVTTIQDKVEPFYGMIGTTPIMRHLFDLIAKVADDDLSTVLIRGESGTGKEMVAKALHQLSSRRANNFVPVNCAAIPDDLLESELFGYTKGAFTGASTNKQGRIQYADQGTLFLDEIGDMKGALQAKLLRVLQEKEFEPVGAFKSIPVNTRVLAATHCDLEKLVEDGAFREDLYYRLSVVPLTIPPLRERIDDIPHLIDGFLEKYADNRGRERFIFSPEAMRALKSYSWRGNVRELENLIQHMAILYSGQTVEVIDLPEKFHNLELIKDPPKAEQELKNHHAPTDNPKSTTIDQVSWEDGQIDFNDLINKFETELIVQAMRQTSGNKKEAAKLLNLKRTTLLEKIKKKAIDGLWEKS